MLVGNYEYKTRSIDYSLMKQDTYEITPTDEYNELYYKSPQYEYQREWRIVIRNMLCKFTNDRIKVNIFPFSNDDYKIAQKPFTFSFIARV